MATLNNREIFRQFLIRQALTNRFIKRSQSEFLKVVERADRDLIEVAIAAVENIGNRSLITRTGARALKKVQDILIKSRKGIINPVVVEFLDELRELVKDQTKFNIKVAANTEVGQSKSINDPDKKEDMMLYPMDGRTFDEWWALVLAGDTDRIMGQVKAGLIAGESEVEIAQRLRGTAENGYADGVTRTTRNSVNSLVPTLAIGAISFANYTFAQANPQLIRKERYTAILDSRTSIICASLDGGLYNIGEGPHPPVHRNCRSVRVPVYVDAGATVADDLSYEEWLKDQSPAVQQQVLGKAKAKLFTEGKLPIADMLRKNGTPMTIQELRESSDTAFELLK